MSVTVKDRVIVVTGGGRGLGRDYALALAARGAKVIVNDLGVSVDGNGSDRGPAEDVAEQIRANGGESIAHGGDATSREGSADLVKLALDSFGRLDGCVLNAGIIRPGIPFEDIEESLFERLVETHVFGAWRLAQQSWRHFVAQRHGRLMLVTSSAAIYGMAGNAGYAMTKASVIGLLRTLAAEGEAHGIRVNAVSPHAWSRMATRVGENAEEAARNSPLRSLVPLSAVAPIAPLLMSDELEFTGRILSVGGGHAGIVYLGETRGIKVDREGFDPQVINDGWATVVDRGDAVVADDTMTAFQELIGHPPIAEPA
ncbi:MAG TPA: SDR family oxidoreductase [Frankiaceae bacterium]|nr:SDR family oxidoreductase [Frankiaceae bacterium]